MISQKELYTKFGDPNKYKDMVLFDVPEELEIGVIPKRIYCNKALINPIKSAFKNLIDRNLVNELKTWDGCFNVRPMRGYEKKYTLAIKSGDYEIGINYLSVHAWGCAIDLNASWNGLGKTPTLSAGFVKCFTDAGFDWGGTWKRKDGMHFQLSNI